MKTVFADSFYWIAVTHPGDQWHASALQARARLASAHLVTTDEALTEFLAAMSGSGESYRVQAVQMVRDILEDDGVTVVPQSRESFLAGLDLFERRRDKRYSLTDCIAMNTMRAAGITEILTNDHHFAQEGFTVLITR